MFTTPVNLRKFKAGFQPIWTEEELLAGLQYFHSLYNYFPAAGEIDIFPYLPSARSIQRSHGGLIKLRKKLLPNEESDHTRGVIRQKLASEGNKRAKRYEEEFYNFLLKHFEEISVHEHKIVRPGNVACDMFIYLGPKQTDGIVIDLFYAQDLVTLLKIVNIKIKRYATLPFETYFVLVGNASISNEEIDIRIKNRHLPLPPHISVVTEQSFESTIINTIKNRSLFTKTSL